MSDRVYLKTHKKLKRLWDHAQSVYAELDSSEQWDLHDYFQPTKDLRDDQLLEHRVAITAKHPNLPHQAGRALNKLDERAAVYALNRVRAKRAPAGSKGKRQRVRNITVKAVVRPEIDLQKLSRALLMIAKDQMEKERAAGDSSTDLPL
jgi:hypothetical protein